MKYTVEWRPSAEDALADAWMHASDKQAINKASNRVDPLLESDPETKGYDFYGDRLIVIGPLHVVFRVDTIGWSKFSTSGQFEPTQLLAEGVKRV